MFSWYRKHRSAIQTILMCAAALTIAACMAIEGPHPLEGKVAPEFTAPTLDGDSVTLADYQQEKVVVLDFWASWCPPCREGLPAVADLARKYAGKDVAVYGVNQGEEAEHVAAFLKAQGIDLPVILDEQQTIGALYGVQSIPQTVIIDKSGRVIAGYKGYFSGLESAIEEDIAAALSAVPAKG